MLKYYVEFQNDPMISLWVIVEKCSHLLIMGETEKWPPVGHLGFLKNSEMMGIIPPAYVNMIPSFTILLLTVSEIWARTHAHTHARTDRTDSKVPFTLWNGTTKQLYVLLIIVEEVYWDFLKFDLKMLIWPWRKGHRRKWIVWLDS